MERAADKTRLPDSLESRFGSAMRAYNAEDDKGALRMMEECARDGHSAAMVFVAIMYRDGEGTSPSPERYRHWIERFRELAESGSSQAQWELSCHYRSGNHFSKSIEKANQWLERAAENGHADAQHHLACYLRHGENGYRVNSERARFWAECAIKQGHPEALYTEAMEHYKDGRPTEYAIRLLRQAAEQRFLPATEELRRISN